MAQSKQDFARACDLSTVEFINSSFDSRKLDDLYQSVNDQILKNNNKFAYKDLVAQGKIKVTQNDPNISQSLILPTIRDKAFKHVLLGDRQISKNQRSQRQKAVSSLKQKEKYIDTLQNNIIINAVKKEPHTSMDMQIESMRESVMKKTQTKQKNSPNLNSIRAEIKNAFSQPPLRSQYNLKNTESIPQLQPFTQGFKRNQVYDSYDRQNDMFFPNQAYGSQNFQLLEPKNFEHQVLDHIMNLSPQLLRKKKEAFKLSKTDSKYSSVQVNKHISFAQVLQGLNKQELHMATVQAIHNQKQFYDDKYLTQQRAEQRQFDLKLTKPSSTANKYYEQKLQPALKIQKIKQASAPPQDVYEMSTQDIEIVNRYSRKSQNIIQSFENFVKGSLKLITETTRNKLGIATEGSVGEDATPVHRFSTLTQKLQEDVKETTNEIQESNKTVEEARVSVLLEQKPIIQKQKTFLPKIKKSLDPVTQDFKPSKQRITICLQDTQNEYLGHPINKTFRHIQSMLQLVFKTKDHSNSQIDQLFKHLRYFGIPISKLYKGDMLSYIKTKEFVALAKERINIVLSKQINKVNDIEESQLPQNQTLKYHIGQGNNHMLVKQVFKQRSWWQASDTESFDECQFLWTQWIKDKHINKLQPFEQRDQTNMQDAQESENQQFRIYNKMQGNYNLSDKKHMFLNMKAYYESCLQDPFKVLPVTYVVNDGLNDPEFDKFEQYFKSLDQIPTVHNVWIVKPGENTNRGCGIIVSKNFDEIKQIVRDKAKDQDKTAIIQKYIENPLLINKRKFDIRCYGVLTSINGKLSGYFYQDGYLRTSCKEFNVTNLNNKFIHLTNDAIQKYSDDYGKFENANKLSYQDFDKYFDTSDYDLKFTRDFLPQIRTIITHTFKAVQHLIDPQRRQHTFEIFGYDFMIDDSYALKLIEVNTNPCLEVCCPLLARIIPNLLESAFKVSIDPMFQTQKKVWNGSEVMNDLKMELIFLK